MDRLILVNDMKADMSYQRVPDEKRIKKIAGSWDDMKANLIHVSHRPDGYYVMDGNHTRLAYKTLGGEKLPCRVYEGLTIEDEARIFSELNMSQKKPSFAEILRARATAGCELEKSYLHLLDEAKIAYVFDSAAHGCTIKCHSALIAVYKKTTYSAMLRALLTAKKAADGREEFFQTGFFPGLCSVIIEHPEVDDMRLIDCVKKTTSSKIREIADKYKRGITGGGLGSTVNYRKAYLELYNKGLRKNKIQEIEIAPQRQLQGPK